jgi:alpha-beta hydrolase superfamily lysophospholipase
LSGSGTANAQKFGPEDALARLFAADEFDADWFSPALLQQVPLPQLQQAVLGLHGLFGTFQAATAEGDEAYSAQFSGGTVEVHATFDDQVRIATLAIVGFSYALADDEQEISFRSGSDPLYGTLLVPAGVSAPPVALLIAGSGPTDRNGNSPLLGLQVNSLAAFARALAGAGVASLRYDKFGSGKTGPGAHAPNEVPTFDTYLDEARDALAALRARPEVDATRALVLGHSEGGLFALLLAQQQPLSALLLAAPLSVRFLDTLRRQLVAQDDAALAAGQLTQAQHDRLLADLDTMIAGIRTRGTIPPGLFADAPDVAAMFAQPGLGAYLQQEDSYDPAQLAARLPTSLPVLALHGDLDMNVTDAELQHLLDGFRAAGNTNVQARELPNVDHEFRQVPPGQQPLLTVTYPFAPAATDAVTGFAAMVLA